MPKTLTLLIGPNGAGKSTLLKACTRDYSLSSGSITLNQQPLSDYSDKQLASLRAVMTQDYSMGFNFSVRDIVSMGCFIYEEQLSKQAQDNIVNDVMTFMHINHLSERQFSKLSGGEQQRTQLARVLTQLWHPDKQEQPRYLFLDEPTSSLDIFHQYQVLSLAKQLTTRNIAVLAVIHDLSLAACFADQLVLLNQGEIYTQGRPASVLQKQHLLDVYGIGGYYFQASEHIKPSVLIEHTS